jgi:hypothetical protein
MISLATLVHWYIVINIVFVFCFLMIVQDIEIPMYGAFHNQFPQTPMMEDLPQIETKSILKHDMTNDDCFLYDKYRDCMNGTLEEIISLCSSQDHSLAFPML